MKDDKAFLTSDFETVQAMFVENPVKTIDQTRYKAEKWKQWFCALQARHVKLSILC